MTDNKKTNKRLVQCVVVSDRMDKTRVAKIERRIKHPVVGKYIKRTTKIFFHDEKNSTRVGDNVVVQETKPMSKNKSFVLISAK